MKLRWVGFGLCLASLLANAQTAAPVSALQFASSDAKLTEAFQWAKSQALAYAHAGTQPVGAWYEAALPGRDAFCMRDVSHQTTGAAALGLYDANRNMLERFGQSVSSTRDWAGYWEINRQGRPSSADYVNDADFWYNLPANFDVLDASVRMWQWTGDARYLHDPGLRNLRQHSTEEYLDRWQLRPENVLARPRLMNQRQAAGRFVRSRGIPSYTEERTDFSVGTDLLAAEFVAFQDMSLVAGQGGDAAAAKRYTRTAEQILALVQKKAWNAQEHHISGFFTQDGGAHGSGDAMALYFGAVHDPQQIRAALDAIESPQYLAHMGIEAESYLPQTFYRYGEKDAAYGRILDLSDPAKARREYPEVSYSVVAAIVTGAMGVNPVYDPARKSFVVNTLAQLPGAHGTGKLSGLHVLGNVVDLAQMGVESSALTNRSGPAILWRASFPGKAQSLRVNGHAMRATVALSPLSPLGQPVSSVVVTVRPGAVVTVSRPDGSL